MATDTIFVVVKSVDIPENFPENGYNQLLQSVCKATRDI
jgi:hypothetical protein